MSFLDKIVAAISPPVSAEDRDEARRKAGAMARPGDWLSHVLEHHRRIEACFALALGANSVAERRAALKDLAAILTAHANAEEAVLYPSMANGASKAYAGLSYEEHAMTRIQMGSLEMLDPMGQEWRDKLEHIRGAVQTHVYEEEHTRFPELRAATTRQDDQRLTRRFLEEFDRCMGSASSEPFRPKPEPFPQDQVNEGNQKPPVNWGAADY